MVVDRVPGEKLYIDWIGDQPELLVDPTTGVLGMQRMCWYSTAHAGSAAPPIKRRLLKRFNQTDDTKRLDHSREIRTEAGVR